MAGTLERKTSAAVPEGEISSVETLSPSLMSTAARSVASTGRPAGTSLMLGPLTTVTASASPRARGQEAGIGGGERGWIMARGAAPRPARIGDHAGEGGGGRGQRRAEIDLIVLHPAPSGEVAIEGAQAPPARGGDVADARAGAAGGLGYRGARHEQIGEEALSRHDLEDPAAPREDHQVHARRDALALDGLAHRPHVFPGGIGAGADHDLLQRGPRRFPHRHDLVGRRGEGDERLEAREIELDLVVVLRVGVGGERRPLVLAAEEGEVAPRRLVGREHARGQRQLGPHVADGRALRQRQRGRARAPVLEDLSTPAAHGVASQQLEDDVLGVHPGPELSR